MAEKYGSVPPRFSKEWWDYFWTYYKGYVIAIVFVIILTVVTVVQKVNSPRYDITLTYAGPLSFSDECVEIITDELSPMCEDVDGNGEKALRFSELTMNPSEAEYSVVMEQKLYLSIAVEDIYLYILEGEASLPYIGDSPDDSGFLEVKEWCKRDIPEDKLFTHNDYAYGINVSECEVFRRISEEYGADFSNTYLFVRYAPREDQKEQVEGFKAAKKLATELVSGK